VSKGVLGAGLRVTVTRAASALSLVWLSAAACESSEREFRGGAAGAADLPGDGGSDTSAGRGSDGGQAESAAGATAGGAAQGGNGSGGEADTGELKRQGEACSGGDECDSGYCRDDVCCESACEGACEACVELFTGEQDGTCAPAVDGTDPHDDCEVSSGESCGSSGTCDGERGCSKYGANQVCEEAACSGSDFSPVRTCDGLGSCEAQATVPCGEFPCSVTGCQTPCTVDSECPGESYCATNVCANKKVDGVDCNDGGECRSNHCVDGVCCESACAGTCVACSNAKTDKESGRCVAIPLQEDPDNECAVDNVNECGTDGTCTGGGACRVQGVGTACGSATCSGNTLTPTGSCNGASMCNEGAPRNCDGHLKCASGTACRTTCTGDTHCVTGYYCSSNSCLAKKDEGATCQNANECASGACRDNVCCESSCSLACQACSAATTGLANGTCGPRTASASLPCPAANPTSCKAVDTDISNCGACGRSCPSSSIPGTTPMCTDGDCSVACPAGTLGDGVNVCIPVTTVAAGSGFACGLRTDGHVNCWGDTSLLNPAGLSSKIFKSISANWGFVCGILDNLELYCWGDQPPTPPSGTFYALAAGQSHVCGIKTNRGLSCATTESDDETTSPPTGSFKWITSGNDVSCALAQGGNTDSRGTCWGTGVGQISSGAPSLSDSTTFKELQLGGGTIWRMLGNGTVTGLGVGAFYQPDPATVFETLSPGTTTNRCGILPNNSMQCWGADGDPAAVAPAGTFTAVATGISFQCAVRSNGQIHCWGDNSSGQAPASVAGPFQGYR